MTQEETYNGWTNRETWLVSLHFSNDQGVYATIDEDILPDINESDSETKRVDFADRLQALAEELSVDYLDSEVDGWDGFQSGFITDLLRNALGRVNWIELADSWDEESSRRWALERGEDVSAEVES